MTSLRARLLTAASCVLAMFILLCGAGLERAFRDSATQAEREKLQGLVYALLGAAEPAPGGHLSIDVNDLPDRRFRQPESGLEAALLDSRGNLVWRSPSLRDAPAKGLSTKVGAWDFRRQDKPDRFSLAFGVRWLAGTDKTRHYTLWVAEDTTNYEAQLATFRTTLWLWLIGAASLLLLVQAVVLHWGLTPLRRLVQELRKIESGSQSNIESSYPKEITPLTGALNAMIVSERNQQTRYRNALADLAHSLKTPLAVLKGMMQEEAMSAETRERLHEQAGRIQEIAEYQLRKAAMAGWRTLSEPIELRPLAEKIAAALQKVYADKQVRIQIAIPAELRLRADTGDCYELLGNLLDNAAKWCKTKVRVEAEAQRGTVRICVHDDGPGFPDQAEKLLARGVRADTRMPGHGIGLAAVAELVKAYEGSIQLGRSDLGGAKVEVTLNLG